MPVQHLMSYMRRRAFLVTAGTGTLAALAGCSLAGGADPGDVEMTKNAYIPREIEVSVGDTVTWVNNGSRGHSITAYEDAIPERATYWASGGFDSESVAREAFADAEPWGNVPSGESWSHTFETPGEHAYFCIPHERAGMVGTVVVRE
jgi:plastocyanin